VKGTLTREHVIVANVDTVFLVSGLGRELNLRRLERYLTLAWKSGARPVVVLNKTDLSSEVAERTAEVEAVASGVPVHPVCAHKPASLSALGEYLGPGRTVALLGSSGVGKSTLINALLGCQRQFVREIRRTDGRGRHATAFRELVILPGGGMIIDNPGMREIQLWGEERDLGGAFADVEELASRCRFRRCSHESEPGCAVKEALAEGELDPGRYRSYLKLKRELEHLAQKQDEKARQNTKARWKRIAVEARRRKKHESRHE
jgi:ribosome biogenesis GTPase